MCGPVLKVLGRVWDDSLYFCAFPVNPFSTIRAQDLISCLFPLVPHGYMKNMLKRRFWNSRFSLLLFHANCFCRIQNGHIAKSLNSMWSGWSVETWPRNPSAVYR